MYGSHALKWLGHVLRMWFSLGKELVPNPVVQTVSVQASNDETAQREKEADEEIEALLVGNRSVGALGNQTSKSLSQNQPEALASAASETNSEEEADDRQSHKVGA